MTRTAIRVTLILLATLVPTVSAGTYSGGDGSANYPWRISNVNDINELGTEPNDWDNHFVMTADINLADYTGTQYNIIGTGFFIHKPIGSVFVSTPFTGTFDGGGFEVSNFNYSKTATGMIDCIGLFGVIDGVNAEVRNLRMVDANVIQLTDC